MSLHPYHPTPYHLFESRRKLCLRYRSKYKTHADKLGCSHDWPCHDDGGAGQRQRAWVGGHRCTCSFPIFLFAWSHAPLTPITALRDGIMARRALAVRSSARLAAAQLGLGYKHDGACGAYMYSSVTQAFSDAGWAFGVGVLRVLRAAGGGLDVGDGESGLISSLGRRIKLLTWALLYIECAACLLLVCPRLPRYHCPERSSTPLGLEYAVLPQEGGWLCCALSASGCWCSHPRTGSVRHRRSLEAQGFESRAYGAVQPDKQGCVRSDVMPSCIHSDRFRGTHLLMPASGNSHTQG